MTTVGQLPCRVRTIEIATRDDFVVHADLDAFDGGRRCYVRSEERWIPRDHV